MKLNFATFRNRLVACFIAGFALISDGWAEPAAIDGTNDGAALTIKVEKRYLNLPVKNGAPKRTLRLKGVS
jgi:hypothetical protein